MNVHYTQVYLLVAAFSLVGCAATSVTPPGAADARNRLTQLQNDPQLASRIPVSLEAAEIAVLAAEQPRTDEVLGQHLVVMADRKVEIARARALERFYEDQRRQLGEQRESARLDSRTREADQALRRNVDLQRQIDGLNAEETERGLLVTLGDLLFASGRAELNGNANHSLITLTDFLNRHPERTVTIEGHTDNVGSESANFGLSQRRADSVKSHLQSQGITASRLLASGKGEGSPVAGNDSAAGRQLNRRVEIIISNNLTSAR
ncbi:OmpA family protein [Ectopseudomonas chengduensis]|nr:OmpA family protein [Pseudomonas chengduensis]WKC36539.1 OmpA family protein [Pseudomonas chengduensis]